MLSRNVGAIVSLVGFLVGCTRTRIDVSADCLERLNNDPRCCDEGSHVDNGTCCNDGSHAVSDVEYPDWKICIADDEPCVDPGPAAVVCRRYAGTDGGTDAQ